MEIKLGSALNTEPQKKYTPNFGDIIIDKEI